jgi:proteasome lid subunit RPN8/RPN11
MALTNEMGGTEWLGYLKGFPTEDGFHIDGMVIPKQTVNSVSVEVDEGLTDEDIIGTIHSHHGMGAFFSSTDNDYIGSNNPVMLVITSNGSAKCAVRHTLACGNFMLIDAEFEVLHADNPEIKEFITDALTKVTKKVYVNQYTGYQAYGWQNNYMPGKTFVPGEGYIDSNDPKALAFRAGKALEYGNNFAYNNQDIKNYGTYSQGDNQNKPNTEKNEWTDEEWVAYMNEGRGTPNPDLPVELIADWNNWA